MSENTENEDKGVGAIAGAPTPTGVGGAAAPEAEEAKEEETAEAAETPKRKMRMLSAGVDHKAGDILEFDNEKAVELIHAGLAESVE